jgi:hypothetical protein
MTAYETFFLHPDKLKKGHFWDCSLRVSFTFLTTHQFILSIYHSLGRDS